MSPFIVPVAFFVCAAFTIVGVTLIRAVSRRQDPKALGGNNAEVIGRLERMEQAIDAIAVEVERISEAQRFTTKLLSERTGAASLPAGRSV